MSTVGSIAVVHSGIVENATMLRARIRAIEQMRGFDRVTPEFQAQVRARGERGRSIAIAIGFGFGKGASRLRRSSRPDPQAYSKVLIFG